MGRPYGWHSPPAGRRGGAEGGIICRNQLRLLIAAAVGWSGVLSLSSCLNQLTRWRRQLLLLLCGQDGIKSRGNWNYLLREALPCLSALSKRSEWGTNKRQRFVCLKNLEAFRARIGKASCPFFFFLEDRRNGMTSRNAEIPSGPGVGALMCFACFAMRSVGQPSSRC